jgi:3-polyprenyl-4-hydroxybenzoate decarboxylase
MRGIANNIDKQSLRGFLHMVEIEFPDELLRINQPVDQRFDMTSIVFELERVGRSPIVVLEKVDGFQIPVVTNVAANRNLLAACLGVAPSDLPTAFREQCEKYIPCEIVGQAAWNDVVIDGDDVDLTKLPIPLRFSRNLPNVRAVYVPHTTCGAFMAIISMKKTADGEPQMAIMATLGTELYTKYVIVVDDDVDIFDMNDVMWAIATRVRAEKDIFLIPGAKAAILDPTSDPKTFTVTKMGIGATRPSGRDFAERLVISQEQRNRAKNFDVCGHKFVGVTNEKKGEMTCQNAT